MFSSYSLSFVMFALGINRPCMSSSEKCCSQTEHTLRPFPDYQSPGLHNLAVHMTPTVNRTVAYQSRECSLENRDSISKFAQEFDVSEECVKTYLDHLKLLELKKEKRKKEILESLNDLPRL